MELMSRYPDKYFELSIVDPPYGLGEDGSKSQSRLRSNSKWKNLKPSKYTINKRWDVKPTDLYFKELSRVSKNQIIWGANYFGSMPPSSCWVAWDKKDGKDNSDFADIELAWTSFKSGARLFKKHWVGFGAINAKETRIHPTQKPVALHKWLLHNYAKPGDKILDTHLGSGSIAIACHDYGYDLTACELDKEYFEAAMKRISNHTAQMKMF